MPSGPPPFLYNLPRILVRPLCLALFVSATLAAPSPRSLDFPPTSPYLAAQVGGIVGAYATSLVLVAVLLLVLSKRRREHLNSSETANGLLHEPTFDPFAAPSGLLSEEEYTKSLEVFGQVDHHQPPRSPRSPRSPTSPHYRNFSLPTNSAAAPVSPVTPLSPTSSAAASWIYPSPTSTTRIPGRDFAVDQTVVEKDRRMAQQQLEDMYRHVMEHEDAKESGQAYAPTLPTPASPASTAATAPSKRERNKPSNLNLAKDNKSSSSRVSSFFSALKSPRKKKDGLRGLSISSPVTLTPMTGTFPRHDDQEMNALPVRHYAPPPPPPPPPVSSSDMPSFRRGSGKLPTPDMSPQTESIAERIDAAFGRPTRERSSEDERDRDSDQDVADGEPSSSTSERSDRAFAGLPLSPKPGVNRFPRLDTLPTLPASPRPGQSFCLSPASARSPSSTTGGPPALAVRTNGTLPLRAYDVSPSTSVQTAATRQTVFTRAAAEPRSPNGAQTPYTGAAVPYTPYQPFSPVVPITPSLVTRADRKRMKKLEPKTPTVEMVADSEDVW